MGGSSKKQTVGYRYRMGLHLVLCQGPVDAVQEIQMGERTAWGDADRGPLFSGHGLTSLPINKPTLFGGDEREGGVVGTIDVLPGGPSQGRNDYLMARLGSAIPAFRGVLSLVARQILFAANNPYIKPWAVRVRRFLVTMEAIEVELERDVPVGLPVRAHASGTIVESASGYTRMELTWQVDSVLGERVERQFADQIKAALDDDHTFTLQYLDQAVVR